MKNVHPAIQDQHWALIERTFPHREALRSALDELTRESLVSFAAHVIVARNSVRDRERGLEVDGAKIQALTLEDLTDWIVGRGRKVWASAVNKSDAELAGLFKEYLDQTTPQVLGEAFRSYSARFDDDLNEAVESHLAKLS